MDSGTAFAVVTGLCILMMGFVTLAAIFRPAGNTNITNYGDQAQNNAGQRLRSSGLYSSIQFHEDSIARLAHLKELTRTLNVVLSAVKNGNYRGDPLIMLIDIGRDIEEKTSETLFCTQLAREGDYPYQATESELDEAYRAGGKNGNGHRAA